MYATIGAPVVTVLENTIGNIWFEYIDLNSPEFRNYYDIKSLNLFVTNKTFSIISSNNNYNMNTAFQIDNVYSLRYIDSNNLRIAGYSATGFPLDNTLLNTPIEIRVYN